MSHVVPSQKDPRLYVTISYSLEMAVLSGFIFSSSFDDITVSEIRSCYGIDGMPLTTNTQRLIVIFAEGSALACIFE